MNIAAKILIFCSLSIFLSQNTCPMQPAQNQIIKSAPSFKFIAALNVVNRDIPINFLPQELGAYVFSLQKLLKKMSQTHPDETIFSNPTLALVHAASIAFVEIIPDLIILGAQVNKKIKLSLADINPLVAACGYDIKREWHCLGGYLSLESQPPSLSKSRHAAFIEKLIEYGANINQHINGKSIINHAIQQRNEEAIAALLQNNINIHNLPIKPLFYALHVGKNINIIRALLQYGAYDPLATNGMGRNALQIAQDSNFTEAVELLKPYFENQT